jgi:hypothetical protein
MMDLLNFLRGFRPTRTGAITRGTTAAPGPSSRLARAVPSPRLGLRWELDGTTGRPMARWSITPTTGPAVHRTRIARVLVPARGGRVTRHDHKAAA